MAQRSSLSFISLLVIWLTPGLSAAWPHRAGCYYTHIQLQWLSGNIREHCPWVNCLCTGSALSVCTHVTPLALQTHTHTHTHMGSTTESGINVHCIGGTGVCVTPLGPLSGMDGWGRERQTADASSVDIRTFLANDLATAESLVLAD